MKTMKKIMLILLLSTTFVYIAAQGNESVSLNEALQDFDKTVRSISADQERLQKLYSEQCSKQIRGLIEDSYYNIDFNFFLGFFDSKEQPEVSVDYLIRHLLLKPFSDCGFYPDLNNRDKMIYDENISVSFHRSSKRANKLSQGVLNNNRDDTVSETTEQNFLASLRNPRSLNIYIGHSRYGKGLDFFSRKLNFKNSVSFERIREILSENPYGSLGLGIISCDSSKYVGFRNQDSESVPVYTLNGVFYAQNIMEQVTTALDKLWQQIELRKSVAQSIKVSLTDSIDYIRGLSKGNTDSTMLFSSFTGDHGSEIPIYLQENYNLALRQIRSKNTSFIGYLTGENLDEFSSLSQYKPIYDLMGIIYYTSYYDRKQSSLHTLYKNFYRKMYSESWLLTTDYRNLRTYAEIRRLLSRSPLEQMFSISSICSLPYMEYIESPHNHDQSSSLEICGAMSDPYNQIYSLAVPFATILTTEIGAKVLSSWEALSKKLAKIIYHKAIQHYAQAYETYTKSHFISYMNQVSKNTGLSQTTVHLLKYLLENYYEAIFFKKTFTHLGVIDGVKTKMQKLKQPVPSNMTITKTEVSVQQTKNPEFNGIKDQECAESATILTKKNIHLVGSREIHVFYPGVGQNAVLSRTGDNRIVLNYESGTTSISVEHLDGFKLCVLNHPTASKLETKEKPQGVDVPKQKDVSLKETATIKKVMPSSHETQVMAIKPIELPPITLEAPVETKDVKPEYIYEKIQCNSLLNKEVVCIGKKIKKLLGVTLDQAGYKAKCELNKTFGLVFQNGDEFSRVKVLVVKNNCRGTFILRGL